MRIPCCKHGKISSKLLSIQHLQINLLAQRPRLTLSTSSPKKNPTPKTLGVHTTNIKCVAITVELVSINDVSVRSGVKNYPSLLLTQCIHAPKCYTTIINNINLKIQYTIRKGKQQILEMLNNNLVQSVNYIANSYNRTLQLLKIILNVYFTDLNDMKNFFANIAKMYLMWYRF